MYLKMEISLSKYHETNEILEKLLKKHKINEKLSEISKKYSNELEIYPKNTLIFNAFNFFELKNTKIILIGQDPYINKNQAMGLSFSIPNGVKLPPSLKNIYKCIEHTCNINMNYNNGNLTPWAEQGILLLNKSLTVFQKLSNSHKNIWKQFTNELINIISSKYHNIIFILWGNDAKSIRKFINHNNNHHILEYTHPSPLSRNPFNNCNHFIKTNEILIQYNKTPINWQI
jgi:uracil-DNA glycosylase